MPIKQYENVTSVSDYLEVTRIIRKSWPQDDKPKRTGDEEKLWFRGQRCWEWGLSPKIYRPPYDGADEDEIRLEFQSQAIQLISGRVPASKWDWYFLMQHHFVPTRLLDWTENSLIALFFAVEEEKTDCDSVVWVIDPWWLNENLHLGLRGPILPEYSESNSYLRDLEDAFKGKIIRRNLPAAIEPPHVDRRVAAQSSRFLVFGTTTDLARTQIVKKRGARIAKIRISSSDRPSLRKELDDCGVNFSLVYPDLEGLALHLLWRWKAIARRKRERKLSGSS
jgi:FRG domain